MRQVYFSNDKTKETFKSYVSRTKQQIESELARFSSNISELSLHPQIEYAILSKGKRLRPILVVLSAESVGGSREKALPLALALELLHTATLVHDDIIDQDEVRRDKLTVHKKWSVSDAILTGDALIALAVELASGYDEEVLKIVARSALELCDGERLDIASSLETINEEAYFKRITEKSASLFRASTCCGALAGSASPSEITALSSFGENFGIAYQLKDDIVDLTHEGTDLLKDQQRGNVTLPLIHFYANCGPNQRKIIERKVQTLSKENLCSHDVGLSKSILEGLRQSGSIGYCEKKMEEHLNQAVTSISILRDSKFKGYLTEMTGMLQSQA